MLRLKTITKPEEEKEDEDESKAFPDGGWGRTETRILFQTLMQDTYVARRQWTGVGTFSEIIGTIERLVFLWGHIATRVCVVGVELVVMVVSVAKCHDLWVHWALVYRLNLLRERHRPRTPNAARASRVEDVPPGMHGPVDGTSPALQEA